MKRLTIAGVLAAAIGSMPKFPSMSSAIVVTAMDAIPAVEPKKNEMVENAKDTAKNVLGFVGQAFLWGAGAALIGFGFGYGTTKGVQVANTGRLKSLTTGAEGETGGDGTMTTGQAGARGGRQRAL